MLIVEIVVGILAAGWIMTHPRFIAISIVVLMMGSGLALSVLTVLGK